MAVTINGPKADGKSYTFNFVFTDRNETHVLHLENAVLHHRIGEAAENANATIQITHEMFIKLLIRQVSPREILFSEDVSLEGSELDLVRFFALIDRPNEVFDIVTP